MDEDPFIQGEGDQRFRKGEVGVTRAAWSADRQRSQVLAIAKRRKWRENELVDADGQGSGVFVLGCCVRQDGKEENTSFLKVLDGGGNSDTWSQEHFLLPLVQISHGPGGRAYIDNENAADEEWVKRPVGLIFDIFWGD